MNPVEESKVDLGEQAAALLEKVKALPMGEQHTFARLFQGWEVTRSKTQQLNDVAQWPDFAGRMKVIFGERTIPGDPQEFWDEERGR